MIGASFLNEILPFSRREGIRTNIDNFGYTLYDPTLQEVVIEQSGVFRTNCLDWSVPIFVAVRDRAPDVLRIVSIVQTLFKTSFPEMHSSYTSLKHTNNGSRRCHYGRTIESSGPKMVTRCLAYTPVQAP